MILNPEIPGITGMDVLLQTAAGPMQAHVVSQQDGFLTLKQVHTVEPSRVQPGAVEWCPMPPLKGKHLHLAASAVVYWFHSSELEKLVVDRSKLQS